MFAYFWGLGTLDYLKSLGSHYPKQQLQAPTILRMYLELRFRALRFRSGFRGIKQIMENQMENNMQHDMETEVAYRIFKA